MLKLAIHIIMILALFSQPLQVTLVCIAFQVDQPYLKKDLCENRTTPEALATPIASYPKE